MKQTAATILIVGGLTALGALAIYDNAKKPPPPPRLTGEELKAEVERAKRHRTSMDAWYKENPNKDPEKRDQIRVVRENHQGDDSSREYIFKAWLKTLDQRCDSVERAIMGEPGEWTISCAPGYEYRLTFDEDGTPTRAQRAE